jgi:hypothetical protein
VQMATVQISLDLLKHNSALTPPKIQITSEELSIWGVLVSIYMSDVSMPFHLTFFIVPIWIRLTISVSMKSREINGRVRGNASCYLRMSH